MTVWSWQSEEESGKLLGKVATHQVINRAGKVLMGNDEALMFKQGLYFTSEEFTLSTHNND